MAVSKPVTVNCDWFTCRHLCGL